MNITSINKKANLITRKYAQPIDVYDYFSHQRPFTNLKIILNQQIIWCDKASLSAASPILREQLLQLDNDQSLIFNDIDLKDFLSMLEFIYPIFNPEINETNISCLINLSYRFQFGFDDKRVLTFEENYFFFFLDILQHACQTYVMKYLNTIQRVFNNYHHTETEGDFFVNNNQHDLMSVY
jgi:hypothetical protein